MPSLSVDSLVGLVKGKPVEIYVYTLYYIVNYCKHLQFTRCINITLNLYLNQSLVFVFNRIAGQAKGKTREIHVYTLYHIVNRC